MLKRASYFFFCAGIFTCTWDFLFTHDVAGFTLKIHQLLFLLSLLALIPSIRREEIQKTLSENRLFLGGFLGLVAYYLATTPWSAFPLKSLLYSGWLTYNILTIWFTSQILAQRLGPRRFVPPVFAAMVFVSLVIVFDQVAYHYGYIGGFLGYNQDILLEWGTSRPHAFSTEPSYAAFFLCLSLLLSLFHFGVEGKKKAWLLATYCLALFALFATSSRGGLVALVFGLVISCALYARRNRFLPVKWIAIACAALVAASGLAFFSMPGTAREAFHKNLVSTLVKGKDGSGNARLRAHEYALTIAQETKGIGAGFGASFHYWLKVKKKAKHEEVWTDTSTYGKELVMSTWGQLLGEGGLPGTLLYGMAMLGILRGLWRKWKTSGSLLSLNAISSTILFVTFLAFWIGNVARGDVWIWYALWSSIASEPNA